MTTGPTKAAQFKARLKVKAHSALLSANLDLVRNPPMRRVARLANHLGVTLAIDVGANVGQFATKLRSSGFSGSILSFEPLSQAFAQLSAVARDDPRWDVVHSAVGNQTGSLTINRAANSYSSSLLPMNRSHVQSAPDSRIIGTESVPIDTLDHLLAKHGLSAQSALIKIDTQGYELEVLEGATQSIADASMIKLELSMVELYSGQPLFPELLDYILARGFTMCGVEDGFTDYKSGQMLQFDALFAASALLSKRGSPSVAVARE